MHTSDQLLEKAQQDDLYTALIKQLNKDFLLANKPLDASMNIAPKELIHQLNAHMMDLILNHFSEYLNVLYIIDVPEKSIQSINTINIKEISEQVALAILQREWIKVHYQAQYKI